MAAVRNDRIAVVECVGIDCPAQGFAQPVETRALFRRDADDVFGKRQQRGSPVDFVCDGQELLIGTEREIGLGNRGCEGRSVNQVDDELRPPDALHRAFDAHAFQAVVGRADARRVEEPEKDAADVGPLLDHVARRAGDFRDHRAFLVEQAVQQRRFSYVRGSGDRHGDPLLDGVAQRKRTAQEVDLGSDALHRLAQCRPVGELHVLLRKVQFQFQQRGEVQEFVAQAFQLVGIPAAHLRRGQRMRRARRGGDGVGHGFGLRKIELPGQIGPYGELPGLGHASARGGQQTEDFRYDVGRSVTRDFDRILARVGVRRTEHRGQHVVHDAVAVHNLSVVHRVSVGFGERLPAPEHPVAEGESLPAAHADDCDGPSCGGCGGDDGIVIGNHAVICLRCGAAVRYGVCGRS